MKKISILIGFLMIICLANTQAQTTPASAGGQTEINKVIEFSELDHDFGKIPFGKPVEYDVILKNISSDTVKIENVQVACGCTTPKWKPGPYNAGENFKITLGFSGNVDGTFTKQVTVFFNNGLKQIVRFHGETFKAPDNAAPANAAVQKLKPNK